MLSKSGRRNNLSLLHKQNKWLKNFNEAPNFCLVTPRGREWILSTLTLIWYVVPWAHMSQPPPPPDGNSIRSAFLCTLQQRLPVLSSGVDHPPKLPLFLVGPGPLSNIWFPGPTWFSPKNGILIRSTVFAGLTNVTNRQTDWAQYFVYSRLTVGRYC